MLVTNLSYPIPQILLDSAEYHALSDIEGGSPDEENLALITLTEHLGNLAIDVIGKRFFGDSRFVFTLCLGYIQVH